MLLNENLIVEVTGIIEMRNVELIYKDIEGLEPFDLVNVGEFIQDNLIIIKQN